MPPRKPADPALVEAAVAATESEFRSPTDRLGLRSRVLVFCATFRMVAESLGPAAAHQRLSTAMELLVGAGRELGLSDEEKLEAGLATIEAALTIARGDPSPAEVDRALAEIAALARRSGDGT